MRGFPVFTSDTYGNPVTRLYFDVDEATALQVAGADGGRASDEVEFIDYVSPGHADQAWYQAGLDPAYGRLDGSLVADVGPWTDLADGLPDPTAEGVTGRLYLRYVAGRWSPDDANPKMRFTLGLRHRGQADSDSD